MGAWGYWDDDMKQGCMCVRECVQLPEHASVCARKHACNMQVRPYMFMRICMHGCMCVPVVPAATKVSGDDHRTALYDLVAQPSK